MVNSNSFYENIIKFINQSSTDSLKTKDYIKEFLGLKVEVSFGQGSKAQVPWISFLQEGFTTSNGIYPVYLLYKSENLLILAYGISETTVPNRKWNNNSESISEYFIRQGYDKPKRYGNSLIYKIYDISELPDNQTLDEDLRNIITQYKSLQPIVPKKENFRDSELHLNQILFGPPGTGKTYNSINKAVEIIDSKFYHEHKDNRNKILDKFNEYKRAGQIEFITFHQNFTYEDFVEGIAPTLYTDDNNKDQIAYKIKQGILYNIVERCLSKEEVTTNHDFDINNSSTIWKMSLGNSQTIESEIFLAEAISTNSLIMGYGNEIDFTNARNKREIEQLTKDSTVVDMVHRFKNELKIGDIVIISDGNLKFKGIVQVTGEYYFDNQSDLKQKRKIKWLKRFTESRRFEEISECRFSQMTLYRTQGIRMERLKEFLSEDLSLDNTSKNFVLIIDEINRGNISKIFGELITLLEPSKRIGEMEEIRLTLPYSRREFAIPKNLFIIGTMNTADRSISPIDTALRRRFVFEEIMPQYEALAKSVDGVDLQQLLLAINQRVEYLYDRDHLIGHAYLMNVKSLNDLKLCFRTKIIPLLAEYFYEDWENIKLVLNDSEDFFIKKINKPKWMPEINDKSIYQLINIQELTADHFINIYNEVSLGPKV